MDENNVPVGASGTTAIQKTSVPHSLPPSQVDHVIRDALPAGFHVAKDAKIALQKATCTFILLMEALISSEKVSRAVHAKKHNGAKRLIISASDVRAALSDAGMSHLVPQLAANKRGR